VVKWVKRKGVLGLINRSRHASGDKQIYHHYPFLLRNYSLFIKKVCVMHCAFCEFLIIESLQVVEMFRNIKSFVFII